MAAQIGTVAGGITYSPVSFSYGNASQVIGGGFAFDLPLATAAMFTNTALDFSAQNSKNAQGFFSGVFARAQGAMDNTVNQSFNYQNKALQTTESIFQKALDVQKYSIKKQYGTMNMLKPGSQCFITTAVCKAQGLPDDTWQLMKLRTFRDEYLLTTAEGKALVKEYYRIAPKIVELIDALPNGASVYNYLNNSFITLALSRISVGDYAGAQSVYTAMVEKARELSGFVESSVVVALPFANKPAFVKTAVVTKRKKG